MPSANYTEARLAALYDALNPPGAHTGFYLGLPGPPPRRILDVGCGTGLLACELAARGHEVTGADPAAAMLAVARRRPGGRRVRWIKADAAGLSVRTRFDLILMTGHVFQLLRGDEDVTAALRALRRHLAPGGRIALETRNPAAREWQFWTPEETRQRVSTADGPAEIHYDIQSVAGDLVTYETCFRFPGGGTAVVPDTLRFMSQAELAAFLAGAGLAAAAWYGDWDRSPAGPASPEIIVLAQADGAAGRSREMMGAMPPDRVTNQPAEGPPAPDDGPVLPDQSREDTDAGWGERPEPDDDEWLSRERPPHWDSA